MQLRHVAAVMVVAWAPAGPAAAQHAHHDERALAEDPRLAPGQIAPVLEGLGDHHHPIATSSERAQYFFDQGLRLTYGFNHAEALRSFKEAARLDPDCAMAYWGWALVLGPNLNLPMSPDVVPQAYEAVQQAVRLRDKASEAERAYINALATRYTDDPEADRAPLDAAYADAMQAVSERYPDDLDAATLYAAALMNLSPWDYWTRDGKPKGRTPELLAALERAIEREPNHAGALHYYVHAVEAYHPTKAEDEADRLAELMPGAGHMVHMPSHIYMRVGRYGDSYESNRLAVLADEHYITQCRAQGIYPLGYYPHNIHFMAWSALMQGRKQAALEAARKVAAQVPHDHGGDYWGLFQTFRSMPLYVMTRLAMWDGIMAEPEPAKDARLFNGMWHYARGMAFVHTGKLDEAEEALAVVKGIADDPSTPETLIGFSDAQTLLVIASEVLAGELAARRGDFDKAVPHLDRAVRLEDTLTYNEPPDWYYPVRHTLGAVLLEAGRPREAEAVYWQDLHRHPENGYALFGLEQSLRAQGKTAEADASQARFAKAWKDSDFTLTSSRF